MDSIFYLKIAFIGMAAQMVDGTLGMGHGVTSSTFLLSVGLYPVLVSACVHISKIFTSFASGCAHLHFGNVRKDIFWPLTLFGVGGGVLGVMGLVWLPAKLTYPAVSWVLLLLGIVILFKFSLKQETTHKEKLKPKKITPLGLAAGFFDALGGGGWGPICAPVLMMNGTEPRKVIGSVNLAEFFVTVAIVGTFVGLIGLHNIPWLIVLALAGTGVVMAPVAAWCVKRLSPRILGIFTGLAVIAVNIWRLVNPA